MTNLKGLLEIKTEERQATVAELVERSALTGDFVLLLVLSSVIVTIGLLLANSSVLVGGALVTPLLFPPLSLALAIVTGSQQGIWRGVKNLFSAILIVLVSAVLTSVFFFREATEVAAWPSSLTNPNLLWLFAALASGVAAALALAKAHLSAALPGVAITVALLPPLALTGIGLVRLELGLAAAALQLLTVNFIGVLLGSVVVFALLGFFQMRRVEEKEIKQEQKASGGK